MLAGQVFDLSSGREAIAFLTAACLSYIMIEVGSGFSAEKRGIRTYGWDLVVAFSAALIPAALWFIYFIFVIKSPWQPALLGGISSAPTSAGVLFAMLTAAGLGATWVFKKARVLAVLDDLIVLLLIAPLQIILHGFEMGSIAVLIVIAACLYASFRWQNYLPWPVGEKMLLVYAIVLTAFISIIKYTAHIHLEVLVPAFMLGCLIRHSRHGSAVAPSPFSLDTLIKAFFMLLVGASFPKIVFGDISWGATIGHVLILTFLANLGKCFPILCYRKEVPLKERAALGIAMFPRGEVGAAVLLIALGYGFGGYVTTLAMLSLGLNLLLTGIFVWVVIKLCRNLNS